MHYLILGFGIVGKSLLRFYQRNSTHLLSVWDQRVLSDDEEKMIIDAGAQLIDSKKLRDVLPIADMVVPSPGIPVGDYCDDRSKITSEFDLFADHYGGSIIGVTGSLGKTSVTQLLSVLLKQCDYHVSAAGNIGKPMLDLLLEQEHSGVVLELSSFQLELSKKAICDIAVWTTLYDNHLDRHKTRDKYICAKMKIVERLGKEQSFITTCSVLHTIEAFIKPVLIHTNAPQLWLVHTCSDDDRTLCHASLASMYTLRGVVYKKTDPSLDDNRDSKSSHVTLMHRLRAIVFDNDCRLNHSQISSLQSKHYNQFSIPLKSLPSSIFIDNVLIVIATLFAYGIPSEKVIAVLQKISPDYMGEFGKNRLELCHQKNGIFWYNDSKSTVMAATCAALDQLSKSHESIILILGGLSKGVDRSTLADYILAVPQVKAVYTFGQQDIAFSAFQHFDTLDQLMLHVHQEVHPGDCVLFSPSGASFDLYKNYQQRGEHFIAKIAENTII